MTSRARIVELDGLRGIAILTVLAVHSYDAFAGGWLAIDLFFVMSGYMITGALMRDGSLARFYRRRIARIAPPVLVMIALAYAIAPGFDLEPMTYLYANFVPHESLGSLAHTWYLSVEEQFYLAWPLAFVFFRRGFTLAAVIAVAWIIHVWMAMHGTDFWTMHRSTFSRMDALAVGCALALAQPRIGKPLAWAALALVTVVFFAARPEPLTVAAGLILFPLACAAVVGGHKHISLLRNPVLAYFGERSWGLFLYHYPIFCALASLHQRGNKLEWLALAIAKIALSVAAAEISYRTIERWSASLGELKRPTFALGGTGK
jgi:peptidoglycan/LPS O-acetylase OafA/YrhL